MRGISLEIVFPARTEIPVTTINAVATPRKTIGNSLYLAERAIVISCVLSPISIKVTVRKVYRREGGHFPSDLTSLRLPTIRP